MDWTPMAARFVERYEAGIGQYDSISAFIDGESLSKSSYQTWRKEIPGFAAKLELVDAQREGSKRVPAILLAGLTRPQEKFVIHFRETHERAEALSLVEWTTQDLQTNLAESEDFRRSYDLIEDELTLRIEDQTRVQAAAGENIGAMRMALQADAPEKYLRRAGAANESEGKIRPSGSGARAAARKWGDRFGHAT